MIVTTTTSIEGKPASQYLGVVSGEAVLGANVFRDFLASIRDFVGGRSGSYEKVLKEARNNSLADLIAEAEALNADAVIGVDIDYESVGQNGSMLMVTASGTAVKF